MNINHMIGKRVAIKFMDNHLAAGVLNVIRDSYYLITDEGVKVEFPKDAVDVIRKTDSIVL